MQKSGLNPDVRHRSLAMSKDSFKYVLDQQANQSLYRQIMDQNAKMNLLQESKAEPRSAIFKQGIGHIQGASQDNVCKGGDEFTDIKGKIAR